MHSASLAEDTLGRSAVGSQTMAIRKSKKQKPTKLKCEKCLVEWERDRPETYTDCPYKGSAECLVSKIIELRTFS